MASPYRKKRVEKDRKHDPLENVKAMVNTWAHWFRDRNESGLPPHSWEGRAILRGGSAPRPQDSVHELPMNPIAERVERYMQLMDKRQLHCLIERHLRRRPDESAARKCHLSKSGYRAICENAYYWLKAKLE